MKHTYFSLLIITLATSINIFAEDSWGYKGPLGIWPYCSNAISTFVTNKTPFAIKVSNVDGGRGFIATKNNFNTIGTKITETGVIQDKNFARRGQGDTKNHMLMYPNMKVLSIANSCIDQPKGASETITFNIHIELPAIGEVVLSERVRYKDGNGRLEAVSIKAGKDNAAEKKNELPWTEVNDSAVSKITRSSALGVARFVKDNDMYTIAFSTCGGMLISEYCFDVLHEPLH